MNTKISYVTRLPSGKYQLIISGVRPEMIKYPHLRLDHIMLNAFPNKPISAIVTLTQAELCKISEAWEKDDFMDITDTPINITFNGPNFMVLFQLVYPKFKHLPTVDTPLVLRIYNEEPDGMGKICLKMNGQTPSFTSIHCNSIWQPSDVLKLKKAMGMKETDNFSYEHSGFVTLVPECNDTSVSTHIVSSDRKRSVIIEEIPILVRNVTFMT